jgi:hypothetical protein
MLLIALKIAMCCLKEEREIELRDKLREIYIPVGVIQYSNF